MKKRVKDRFFIENSSEGIPIIVDDEGLDDYYYYGDYKDFEDLCKLLNSVNNEKLYWRCSCLSVRKERDNLMAHILKDE